MCKSLFSSVAVMKILLAHPDCDINQQSDRYRTALHVAVWSNYVKGTQMLLRAGCDVNLKDHYGDTALMLAARKGYCELVEGLLKAGSVLNARDKEGETALHHAANHGYAEVVRLLLSQEAELEGKTMWGHTPLLMSVSNRHSDCALLLLYAGADACIMDRSGKSALQHAAKRDLVECVHYMLSQGAVIPDMGDNDGNTPLIEAIRHGNADVVRLLIQFGCNVQTVHKCTVGSEYLPCSCLELALHSNHLDIAAMLVEAGAGLQDLQTLGAAHPELVLEPYVSGWVKQHLCSPVSLQNLCRWVVRDILKYGLPQKVCFLPLPRCVQDYLAFGNLRKRQNLK